MNKCLFCNKEGPFSSPEHIIPEALGNDDLILLEEVCDNCNQYFGKEIEKFVLGKTPLAFWRTYQGIRKKKGKLPHVDLSQPQRQKGRLPKVHPLHDNLVGFTCHEDYSVSVDISADEIVGEILEGRREQFNFVFTPEVLSMMGRFLCKIGIELVCLSESARARSDPFLKARRFSRFGEFEGLWPIFYFKSGDLKNLKQMKADSEGILEEVFCYQYRLLEIADLYTVLSLTVGTDTWIVSLNDPFPTPVIRSGFPDQEIKLIWYSPEEFMQKCERPNKANSADAKGRTAD